MAGPWPPSSGRPVPPIAPPPAPPGIAPAATLAAPREVLAGLVERVTFHNPANGFCVLRLKARGQRDLITVVAYAAAINPGEFVQLSGSWTTDRVHGRQFRATFLRATAPTTPEGLERYLGAGVVRGIGPGFAKRLVAAFGERVFEVIEQEPARLREVTGIGARRAASIIGGWADQRVIREIMLFLHAHGVGTARAVRIYKTYGADAVQRISEDPYRLARDIRGIGFRTADQIAGRLGIERTAAIRVRAGISFALAEATEDGHCGLPEAALLALTAKLLEVPAGLVAAALRPELADGTVVADSVDGEPCIFLGYLHRAERAIADRLRTAAKEPPPWPAIDAAAAIAWVQGRTGLQLAESQRRAVAMAVRCKLAVITGGPGVGKTTLVNAILKILAAKGVQMALGAPTGRAAKRLAESTGLDAKTIHRLLETDPRTGGFKRSEARPLGCDLLVIDETSMVDVPLMRALLRALPEAAALLIVGDADQLASVGPGRVLGDIIASGVVPVIQLTEVFRQAAGSRIITSAHLINAGRLPDLGRAAGSSDFYFVAAATPEEAQARIITLVRDHIPRAFGLDPVRDVQVLCPMQRGEAGARGLNAALQGVLNPPGEDRVERFGWSFAPRDKVMQAVNDYERDVYNGDIGFVRGIDREASELIVAFDEREVRYGFGELDELAPAYAMTVHKAQGSEFPAVVIPMTTQHYPMLARNLFYTAVTRGKRLVVLVGQKRALAIAVRQSGVSRRWSKLRELLQRATDQDGRSGGQGEDARG